MLNLLKPKPKIRRTTLVNVRYDLGLALLKYQREHPQLTLEECRMSKVYSEMERQVDKATKRLINECEIIEDYRTPDDLRKDHSVKKKA